MKINEDKCHAILSAKGNMFVNIGTAQIQNSSFEKLLGVKLISN